MKKTALSAALIYCLSAPVSADEPCLGDICLGDPLQTIKGEWNEVDIESARANSPMIIPMGDQEPVNMAFYMTHENNMLIQHFISLSDADKQALSHTVSRFFSQDGLLFARGNLMTDNEGLEIINKTPLKSCSLFGISMSRTTPEGYTDTFTAMPADHGTTFGDYEVVFMQRDYLSKDKAIDVNAVKATLESQYGDLKVNRFQQYEKKVHQGRGFKIKLKDRMENSMFKQNPYVPQASHVQLQITRLAPSNVAPADQRFKQQMSKITACQQVDGGFPQN